MILTFKKNGIFQKSDWVYDEEAQKGEYIYSDMTKEFDIRYNLHDPCDLEPGITLRDIFAFVAKNESMFAYLLPGCLISEYLENARETSTDKTEIEYLEIYTILEHEGEKDQPSRISGLGMPGFHGIGKYPNDEYTGFFKDEPCAWSLMGTSVYSLLPLEVRISDRVVIDTVAGLLKPITVLATPSYSLFQIIRAIFWELSWYGSPEDKKNKVEELKDIMKNVDLSDLKPQL